MNKLRTAAVCVLLSLATMLAPTGAAPAAKKSKTASPRVMWEYAALKDGAYRELHTSSPPYAARGVEVYFSNKPPIFIRRSEGANETVFLVSVLDRLGAQGWEVVATPTYRGPEQYLLKRRK